MVDQVKPMSTLDILLDLNKRLFSDEPEKLSNNNQLLRRYTYLDSRAATELGSQIHELPNVFKDQEKAENIINKFRQSKTEGAIKAFNLFVDEIQDPTNRSAKYTEQLAVLKKAFTAFVNDLRGEMETLLPKSLADSHIRPYIEKLNAKSSTYPILVKDTQVLQRDGERLQAELVKIQSKATITLSAVAPEVAVKKGGLQKPSEPPSGLSVE